MGKCPRKRRCADTDDSWARHQRYTLPVAANQRRTPPSSVYRKTRPSLLGLFGVVMYELMHIVTLFFISCSEPTSMREHEGDDVN
jgi:hypothetical protein